MALEFLSKIKGLEFINNIDLLSLGSKFINFIIILGIIVFISLIIFIILYYRSERKKYNIKIHFFEEGEDGEMNPHKDCYACELTIPLTNIKLFYIKSEDMYLPRGTKKTGKNSYWYAILNNREIINFRPKNINRVLKEANLDYDHTDMRYAMAYLGQLIQRNYRDKSVKWWKEYKDVISTVIYLFVMTLALFILIKQIGGLIDKVGILMETANQNCGVTSGIITG